MAADPETLEAFTMVLMNVGLQSLDAILSLKITIFYWTMARVWKPGELDAVSTVSYLNSGWMGHSRPRPCLF